MTEITIKIRRDGDQTCAIIGEMPTELAVGFGNDVKQALLQLENDMSNLQGVCPVCWGELDRYEDGYNILYSCPYCGYSYDEVIKDE